MKIISTTFVLILCSLSISCVYTPKISGPNSVASLETINLGNVDQSILIRGKDTSRPILLFIHGGPGMPMMYMGHKFQRTLEEHFIVVHWDQRGAGKSYYSDLDPNTILISQYLADSKELVKYLTDRFDKEKVTLVCHSWGTYIGSILVHENPEMFDAYVGIGQVVNGNRARLIQRKLLLIEARKRNDLKAIQELEEKGDYILEKWLFKYGGELHNSKSWVPLLLSGLKAPEYSLTDALNVPRGSSFSSKHLQYDVYDEQPLDSLFHKYDLPMYYFQGRFDLTTPSILVQEYFDTIEAPKKELYWFEGSAHFPFFEEPKAFSDSLIKVLK